MVHVPVRYEYSVFTPRAGHSSVSSVGVEKTVSQGWQRWKYTSWLPYIQNQYSTIMNESLLVLRICNAYAE